jgi:hypothetical protein
VLRQSTEQRPIRDVVPAQQHALKEREHDSDVERALVIGYDQCSAVVRLLPAHQELCAEDAQKAASQTCEVQAPKLIPPRLGGQRSPRLIGDKDACREPDEGPGA